MLGNKSENRTQIWESNNNLTSPVNKIPTTNIVCPEAMRLMMKNENLHHHFFSGNGTGEIFGLRERFAMVMGSIEPLRNL